MKFLRTSWQQKKRLGNNNRKKQVWRRARGRHNKIREGRKGRLRKVDIGYKSSRKESGKIRGKEIIMVRNLKDTAKIGKGDIAILAKFGKKKRIQIESKIKEIGGEILNRRK
jgi:large subunit ribosomal protein L32e